MWRIDWVMGQRWNRETIWKAMIVIQARDDEMTSKIIAYLEERSGDLIKKTSVKPFVQLISQY